MRFARLAVFCILLSASAPPLAANSSNDQSSWQGVWKLVSTTINGEQPSADVQWIVNGDHYTIVVNQVRQGDPYHFTLDPANGRIIIKQASKGPHSRSLKGIYKISADTLTVCYDLTGSDYPTSFDAGPGSRRLLYEFRRAQ
jgi:uncharacterized protein (TIGR03067 family)